MRTEPAAGRSGLLIHFERPATNRPAYRDRRIDVYAPITRRLLDEPS
jgi:hypothetical protein